MGGYSITGRIHEDNYAEQRGAQLPINTADRFASQVLSLYTVKDSTRREKVRTVAKHLFRKCYLKDEKIVISDNRYAKGALMFAKFIVDDIEIKNTSDEQSYLLNKHEFIPTMQRFYPEKFAALN